MELNPALARTLGLAAPRDLHALLELDLSRLANPHHVRSALRALAHAEGGGMPERVIAHVATAFADSGTAAPMPPDQVRKALDAARFYLRREVDVKDGSTLFRLFHESLSERLRIEGSNSTVPGGPAS